MADIIPVVANDAASSPPRVAGTISSLLDDSFSYDIFDFGSLGTPDLTYREDAVAGTANGFHANNTIPVSTIVLDLVSDYTVVALDELVLGDETEAIITGEPATITTTSYC